jgi:hypothetical protein
MKGGLIILEDDAVVPVLLDNQLADRPLHGSALALPTRVNRLWLHSL